MINCVTSCFLIFSPQRLYAKTINFAKQYLKPIEIDFIKRKIYIIGKKLTPVFSLIKDVGVVIAIVRVGAALVRVTSFEYPGYWIPTQDELIWGCILYAFQVLSVSTKVAYRKHITDPCVNQELLAVIRKSKTNGSSMLIWRTSHDWNHAFSPNRMLPAYEQLAEKYSIEILEGSSKSELQAAMASNHKKYDRILFHAHATEDYIRLAQKAELTKKSKKALAWLNDHIKNNGVIGLVCCNAGKGEENIAREISRACPTATVYAAKDITYGFLTEYNAKAIPSFKQRSYFFKQRFYSFEWGYKDLDITRVYRNGKVIRGSRRKRSKQIRQ